MAEADPVDALIAAAKSPMDTGRIVLRYENGGGGFLYSNDGGESFALGCFSAIQPTNGDRPRTPYTMVIDGDDRLMFGSFDTIFIDDGTGCSWSRTEELEEKWMRDVAALPSDPRITYAVSSNGGDSLSNGAYRRETGGAWEEVGERLPYLLPSIRVAALPEEGVRIYLTAVDGYVRDGDAGVESAAADAGTIVPQLASYAVLVSDDEGQTYEKVVHGPLGDNVLLEAVDPMNPDRIVLSARHYADGPGVPKPPDVLYVSEDRGQTLIEWGEVTELGGIVFEEDGTVFIGDGGSTFDTELPMGLLRADALGEELSYVATDYPVRCLVLQGEELFACQRWAFGKVDKDTGEYTRTFDFKNAEQLLSCGGESIAPACRTQLCDQGYCKTIHFAGSPLCMESYGATMADGCASSTQGGTGGTGGTGGAAGTTAGSSNAGSAGTSTGGSAGRSADAGSDEASDGGSGCGCSTLGRSSRSGAFAALALVLAFGRRRIARSSRA